MSIAAPMLVISLIIYAGLFGLFIYLVILIIRALKKYIRSKDVRAEKSVLKQNLGEVLKDLRTKNKRRKAYMIYSKYDVMKRCISEMNFPDYYSCRAKLTFKCRAFATKFSRKRESHYQCSFKSCTLESANNPAERNSNERAKW